MFIFNTKSESQDIIVPYFNSPTLQFSNLETFVNSYSNPVQFYRSNTFTGYNGEYEINLLTPDFFWADHYLGPTLETYLLSYDMEVVSFPFLPDCYLYSNGCEGAIDRNLVMPPSSQAYFPLTDTWGAAIFRKKPLTKLINTESQSLASIAYKDNFPFDVFTNRYYLPHSIIKHTIYVHCENNNVTTPTSNPIFSVSWIYDNTRGRMKEYPFCPCNCTNCSESEYDVSYAPKLLHNQISHSYNESNNTVLLPNGTINYFDYSNINSNGCTIPLLIQPNQNDVFFSSSPVSTYNKAYIPPYSLISAPLMQHRGLVPAGYENISGNIVKLNGIEHNYFINTNILPHMAEINTTDYIIYNPSDVTITADNLLFYYPYSYRTIRGMFPTPAEVLADNININGGPYDPQDVPVRTDLRCEDPLFPDDPLIPDDSKYASLYRLASGSMVTLKPCVSVFDAAFILYPNSTLVLDNKPTIIGLHRVAIDRFGGRLIEKHDLNNGTFYLQNKTETAIAPNSYVVNSKIFAGENVDALSQTGPYVAAIGTNLELLASEFIKLEHGFSAENGSEVKIKIDPLLSIGLCPQPLSGGSGNRIRNSTTPEISSNAHIKLLPNPFQVATGIFIENKEGDEIQSIVVMDATGKTIKTLSHINTNYSEISLAEFNDGLYFIIVKTIQNQKVFKAIKQG